MEASEQPWSYLDPMLQQALTYVAEEKQHDAAKIAVLGELGYEEMEIAKQVGMSWRKMNAVRLQLQGGLIAVMRTSGYADGEIIRTLGIPTGALGSAIGALAPTYG
jgi:fibrillarin-like rRNA methylase